MNNEDDISRSEDLPEIQDSVERSSRLLLAQGCARIR